MLNEKYQVSLREVREVEMPEWTHTWHPVSHGMVIDAAQWAVAAKKYSIIEEEYSMNMKRSQMFAVWKLSSEDTEKAPLIGIRNSIDKSLAVGIVCGFDIFVCENLVFSGEEVYLRKHTGRLDWVELTGQMIEALDTVEKQQVDFAEWLEKLKNKHLHQWGIKFMIYDILDLGILPGSKFRKLQERYAIDSEQYGDTLYAMHSAVTNLVSEYSPFQIRERNRLLYNHLSRLL